MSDYSMNDAAVRDFVRLSEVATRLGLSVPTLPDRVTWKRLRKINDELADQINAAPHAYDPLTITILPGQTKEICRDCYAPPSHPAHTPPAPAAERGEGERVMKNLTDRRSAAQDGAVCGNCACGRNDYDARMDAIIWRERYNEILQAVGRVVLSASTSAREK